MPKSKNFFFYFIMNSFSFISPLNRQNLENTQIFSTLHRKLKEDTWYRPALDYSERSTKINRVYLVTGTVIVLSFLLLVEFGTSMVTGCVGFLYPGYKTLALLQQTYDVEVGRKWLIYWFLHSALSFIEIFLFFLNWIPIYWLLKCCFLFWCYAPLTKNGADIVYSYLIQPFFQRNQEVIDNAINHMVRTAHSIYTESDPLVPLAPRQDTYHRDLSRRFRHPPIGWISQQYGDSFAAAILKEICPFEGERKSVGIADLLCKICMDEELRIVFLPCGHLTSCVKCAQLINVCPMCREEITGKVPAFFH